MAKPRQRSAFAAFLTPAEPGTDLEGARLLPLELIDPNPAQPRQHADAVRLAELQADIAARGILQPLVVRPVAGDRYEVVAGERRYQAARALGLSMVPCIIKAMDDAEARAASIRENVHRDDMDPEDEGRYYQSLQDTGMSLREIAAAIGKSHQYVYRRIQLIERPGALLAYRTGRANLEDMVAGQWVAPTNTPMDELGTVTERYNLETQRLDELVDPQHAAHIESISLDSGDSHLNSPQSRTNNKSSVELVRRPAFLKPFHTLVTHVQRLAPEAVPASEQDALRQTVDELINELTVLRRKLETG